MAWQTRSDGTGYCTTCKNVFRPPHSCTCPRSSTVMMAAVEPGQMERLTAQARAEGMLDRLGSERLLTKRILKADREHRFYRKAMERAIERGDEQSAVKWAALGESALNRGDKLARHLLAVVSDRERRADLERRERGVEAVQGKGRN